MNSAHPFSIFLQSREPVMGPSDVAPEPSVRMPADVLLVEDNYLIALDTEAMLNDLGVPSVRSADTVSAALELIAAQVPEFCLLDVNLGQEKSFEVAERLAALGVPFVFATGYGEKASFPAHFATAPILGKPYTMENLRLAVSKKE